ncbi:hypothetical protein [Vibrio coralliirubri]|uniref:hypothetical protein n=1 Tax=Vibrio coralliirubri TaxID=1516159 RepID=UPI0006359AFE|nr:hypothetical protein [Vibrio coralliirubri]CDU11736.1 hypothetical protein VCR17J2_340089 [Vibrio coralliirubri]
MKANHYGFRHTFIDTLKQKGVEEVRVAEVVGHANHNMTYRTSKSIITLYDYLQEEDCNEFLDLSTWLNQGWPQEELKATVMLLRRLVDSSDITQSELLMEGFSSLLLKRTLPYLFDKHPPLLHYHSSELLLNHLYDPELLVMKVVNGGGYSLHRLSTKWMNVTSKSNKKVSEWIMLKKNNQIVGWVLMPHI